MKMKTLLIFETSETTHPTTQHPNPVDMNLHKQRLESVNSSVNSCFAFSWSRIRFSASNNIDGGEFHGKLWLQVSLRFFSL
jgi:hypothetical protein